MGRNISAIGRATEGDGKKGLGRHNEEDRIAKEE
jgi:hypothetical protein